MKKLFVALLAVAGLTACFNEEVVRVQDPTAISFEANWVENATRADVAVDPSTTTTSLKGFKVWGFMDEVSGKVFEGEEVTGSKGNFTYNNIAYWLPGHTYYFAALAPIGGNWTLNTEAANYYGAGIVNFLNANGTEDLIYAANVEEAPVKLGEAKTVNFTFSHLLSKVKFTFTNGFTNPNMYIDVKNVRIVNAPKAGSIDLAVENWWDNDDWQLTEDKVELAFGDACDKTAITDGAQVAANERLTIPASAEYKYNVVFDVVLYVGDVEAYKGTKTSYVQGVALEMGKAYNFSATLNASNFTEEGVELMPIVFDVEEVNKWDEAGDVYVTPQVAVATEDELVAAVDAGLDVVLADDIALNQTLTFGAATRAAEVAEYTLDLNGKTLKNANTTGETDVIIVAAGAKLTICGEGVVEAVTGGDGYAVISEGELVINGGTYKSGVDANGEPNAVIYARGNGKVFVNGGYFPNDNVSKYVLNKKDADRANTVIEVRGGKFENFDPANNAAENAGTNFVAEGYFSLRNGNVYEVVELAGNITLADDVVLSAPLLVKNDLTINLNGHNISSASDVFEVAAGSLTIVGEGEIYAATDNGEPYCAVWAYGNAVVNIYGGTYKVGYPTGDYNDLIYAKDSAVINIHGGKFYNSGKENAFVLNLKDGSAAKIIVDGGSFEKFNPANNNSEGANTNFLAAGFKAVPNGDWFEVVAE